MRVYIRRVLPLNGGNNRNKTGFLFTISMIYKAPGILTEPKQFIYELLKSRGELAVFQERLPPHQTGD